MKISHHLDDVTILAFAAGTLSEALAIVAASHASVCEKCRTAVREAEAVGAQLIEEQAAEGVSDMCRAATLASLDGTVVQTRAPKRFRMDGIPEPLARVLNGRRITELIWRSKAPGVKMVELPLSPAARSSLKLLSIAPGKSVPDHGHGGKEMSLIVQGSYKDHTGVYQVGDVADLDEETEHSPVVNSDVACICLVATEAPTKFKSIFARLLQPFLGI